MRILGIVALGAALLAGCSARTTQTAWSHYDQCSAQTSSFAAMVACGKQNRTEVCQREKACSEVGDAVVAYADSLALSVAAKTMTEPEAQRKWIEFKLSRSDERRREMMAAAAAAAAAGPVVCNRTGNTSICY
jgi:outer membrane murein-binding lipoprotein Lpp